MSAILRILRILFVFILIVVGSIGVLVFTKSETYERKVVHSLDSQHWFNEIFERWFFTVACINPETLPIEGGIARYRVESPSDHIDVSISNLGTVGVTAQRWKIEQIRKEQIRTEYRVTERRSSGGIRILAAFRSHGNSVPIPVPQELVHLTTGANLQLALGPFAPSMEEEDFRQLVVTGDSNESIEIGAGLIFLELIGSPTRGWTGARWQEWTLDQIDGPSEGPELSVMDRAVIDKLMFDIADMTTNSDISCGICHSSFSGDVLRFSMDGSVMGDKVYLSRALWHWEKADLLQNNGWIGIATTYGGGFDITNQMDDVFEVLPGNSLRTLFINESDVRYVRSVYAKKSSGDRLEAGNRQEIVIRLIE